MCGRFALHKSLKEIADLFSAEIGEDGLWDWEPNYNVSPATVIPVVALDGKRTPKVVPMRWGLHPHWRKEPPEGRPMFNARVETAAEKPSFRTPFKRRRCLIPTNGWYEWDRFEGAKRPFYIHEKDREFTVMAGLWDQWRIDEGITLLSATMLTTAATGGMKHLHHRMPVRLPEEYWDAWMDGDSNPAKILETKKGSDDLVWYEVSDEVNSGRSKGEHLIKKA
ncbi:MAG: SOS response-associated peptidase [Hellea sp.]|nr:SOS response-associated peptidase [Hellea sp.]